MTRPIDRFLEKIHAMPDDGCWEWAAASHPRLGYGSFWTGPNRRLGRREGAHRAAWAFAFGPIPDGLFVLHKCDNRKCVRPRHLGTQVDNMHDASVKGRMKGTVGPRARCRRGHEMQPTTKSRNRCMECKRQWNDRKKPEASGG